ncbi:MAG: excinuclease ABC subunit UvrA [bacterium]|nr:excinuclease ABC subunit UvrA [bacterium]
MEYIRVRGAREHNLKNINVDIPRNQLVVITGLSGSGKSSLAFDTLYAEGQRRYVESLSSYARQFLGLMEKPDVDTIEGLSPAISIEQKSTHRNPRSTVGTVTEIYDYLRLLFGNVGVPHCTTCGRAIHRQSPEEIVNLVEAEGEGRRLQILAPLVRGRKGEFRDLFQQVRKNGYLRVRVDGRVLPIEEVEQGLAKTFKHDIDVVVDRLVVKAGIRSRLFESVETALTLGGGLVRVLLEGAEGGGERLHSLHFACPEHGVSIEELAPRLFSFNSPFGACPECSGIGHQMVLDPELVVVAPERSLREGAIGTMGDGGDSAHGEIWTLKALAQVGQALGFSLDTPWRKLKEEHRAVILQGTQDEIRFRGAARQGKGFWEYSSRWEGIIPNLERRYRQTQSQSIREWIERFMSSRPCPGCQGHRLKPESLAVTVGGRDIMQLCALSTRAALAFFEQLHLDGAQDLIAAPILKEVRERLGFLVNVGLDYLDLARAAGTLSGGEAQRIRLATQIGSQLTGVLYILDEPSIGLHQRDNERLIRTLQRLRDLGNTVIVVEHDRDTILAADEVLDLGPGAGVHGGEVVSQGTPAQIMANPHSVTGRFLKDERLIPVPAARRPGNGQRLRVEGLRGNNLRGIALDLPLGALTCVTGVSGSGKSTAVNETLSKLLARELMGARVLPMPHGRASGLEHLDKAIVIDQSPIGRTPRSNPATYTGLFTLIRDLFAGLPESRMRGYAPGRFSFNVKGGRCESCQGDGIIRIEMHFLPDVYVPCEICKGRRYNSETLEVKYRGRSIADVLEMTVEEAGAFFEAIPRLQSRLRTLLEVGLGYVHLGQQATTLSGGEAQRVKLSAELSRRATGRTIYILDEPTTGLHFADIELLLRVLQRLVDRGNTVVVIEHNLDVIKCADHLIDLGPEGGAAGGRVVAAGTPEEVAACPDSHTGRFLAPLLLAVSAPAAPEAGGRVAPRGRSRRAGK